MIVPAASFVESESAVSESIGFILVTGIMVTAIGIIVMTGYPMLQSAMDNGHMQNMENGFILLGKSIDNVAEQKAPTQSVELNLYGGTLETYNSGIINITYTNLTTQWTDSYGMTTVTYSHSGDEQIGYEFGGVFKNIAGYGYVIKNPNIVNNSNFIIPIVNVYSSRTSIGGNGLAKVEINGGEPSLAYYSGITQINFSVKSDFYKGWEIYLDGLGFATHHDDTTKTVYGDFYPAKLGAASMNVTEVNKLIDVEII